ERRRSARAWARLCTARAEPLGGNARCPHSHSAGLQQVPTAHQGRRAHQGRAPKSLLAIKLRKEDMTNVTRGSKFMSNPVIQMPSGSPALPRGRLIFAVDATASREHAWHIARDLQAKMFIEAGSVGVLSLQLVFYGGVICRASRWASRGEELARWM